MRLIVCAFIVRVQLAHALALCPVNYTSLPCDYYNVKNANGTCSPCPKGRYIDVPTRQCKACPVGKYKTGSQLQCAQCARGQYQDEDGQQFCKACPVGQLSRYTAATYCQSCPEGTQYLGDGHPHTVVLGVACKNYTALSVYPTVKPLMYVMDVGNLGAFIAECNVADIHAEQDAALVSYCTFKQHPDPGNCSVRQQGTTNPNRGLCEQCHPGFVGLHCTACPAGKIQSGDQCIACLPGQYNDAQHKTQCKNCPSGKFSGTQLTGIQHCDECPVGRFAGQHGMSVCSPCPVSTFGNPGATSRTHEGDACTDCPPNTYADVGQVQCIQCPAGKYSIQSVANRLLTVDTACAKCGSGRFKPNASVGCLECPFGKHQDQEGATACKPCLPGFYSDTYSPTNCIACTTGTYADEFNSTDCKECPAGKFSGATASTACLNCTAGRFAASDGYNACLPSPPGRYVSGAGASSHVECADGYIAPYSGTVQCVSCGSATSNASHTECVSCTCENGVPRTSTCNPNAGSFHQCSSCDVGYFLNNSWCHALIVPADSNGYLDGIVLRCNDGYFGANIGGSGPAYNACQLKTCTCELDQSLATPATGLQCPVHQTRKCICVDGRSGDNCELVESCTCTNGTPRNASTCVLSADMHQCDSCDQGYYQNNTRCNQVQAPANGNGQIVGGIAYICNAGYHGDNVAIGASEYTACVENACTCRLDASLATPATGLQCPVHQTEKCMCNEGRSGDNCELVDSCTCANGTPRNASACVLSADMHQCDSCDQGYYHNNTKCHQVQAPVNGNGQVVGGIAYICNAGYHGDNVAMGASEYTACVENACTCRLDVSLATPATGLQCPVHQTEKCMCNEGRSGDNCELVESCTCANGTPRNASACKLSANMHQCNSCDQGYYHNNTQCHQVQAPVNGNGQVVGGIAYICDAGYHGDNVAIGVSQYTPCVENVCTCRLDVSLATPATGLQCPVHQTEKCTCNEGRSGENCELVDSCTCDNGTPRNASTCVLSADMHQCDSCDQGYYRNDTRCQPVQAPANGNGQIVGGIAYICNAGYHGDNVAGDASQYEACVENVCTCELNTSVATASTGAQCPVHNTRSCACLPGFTGDTCIPTIPCPNTCATCVHPSNRTLSFTCSSCPLGHDLVNGTCVPFACISEPGSACRECTPQSERVRDNHCTECNPGHIMVGDVCQASNATCDGQLTNLPLQPSTRCACNPGSFRPSGDGAWTGTDWPPCEGCAEGRYGTGETCFDCPTGKYQDTTGQVTCKPHTHTCPVGEGRTSVLELSDIACEPCVSGVAYSNSDDLEPCKPVAQCPPPQYVVAAPTPSSNRQCGSAGSCDSSQFETKPPTLTSDRVCVPLCNDGFVFRDVAADDYECVALACANGTVFQTLSTV